MRTSRRRFAKSIAAAGVALPFATADVLAQKPEEKPLGRALTEVVKAQSGRHLTGDDLARVASSLQELAPLIERLREFPLANSDEPDVTFSSLTQRW